MKKSKYLFIILIIFVLVFIGVEIFRKKEHDKIEDINTNEINTIENSNNIQSTEEVKPSNTISNDKNQESKEIASGEELMQKAEKTLSARGWAGASNNIIGIKDKTAYFYNKETNEFKKIATGVEDIYYKTDFAEEITIKKGSNANILQEIEFVIYE